MGKSIIRFATVGTSAITEQFIESAKTVDGLVHTAVYSRKKETGLTFAEKHGCKNIYTDIEEMAASSEIDAVYIASPNAFHSAQSRIFLEHSKNVICEKPITVTAEEYLQNKKIADKNGVIYMEGIKGSNSAWSADLKDAVTKIGKIALARLDFCQRSSRYDKFMSGIPQNIFDLSLHAGALTDLGIYCVYAAVDLFSKPKDINIKSSFFDNGCDHSGNVVFEYRDFSVSITYSKMAQSVLNSEIIGDSGAVTIGSVSQYTDVILIKDGKEEIIVPPHDKITSMREEAQNFRDFINGKRLNEYERLSQLCRTVCECMDILKLKSQIPYPKLK